jgi:hypothetical protein
MNMQKIVGGISDKVAGFGALLGLFGLVSSLITFIGYELRVLMWIDLWGPLVAWSIRLGLIVGGIAIYFVASALGGAGDKAPST